jgi:hypothetical protein
VIPHALCMWCNYFFISLQHLCCNIRIHSFGIRIETKIFFFEFSRKFFVVRENFHKNFLTKIDENSGNIMMYNTWGIGHNIE